MKKLLTMALMAISLGASAQKSGGDNTLSKKEKAVGWQLLFNGKTGDGWRSYNKKGFPSGWVIEAGTLKALGTAHGDTGGDIVFEKETFENFELVWDWKISTGGNSGVFYHVIEDAKYAAPYHTGPEYQMIDDVNFPEKLEDWQKAGADYAMYDPPANKKLNPVGEWNHSRILFTKEKAEYWLNGKLTASFIPWSEDWTKRRNSGKWDAFPDYGKARTGLIGLQDHGSITWFKNIKIRKL